MATIGTAWIEHNQRFLATAVAEVRARLEHFANQLESFTQTTAADSELSVPSSDSENEDPLPALEVRQGQHTLYCFAIDGKQQVAISAGSALFVFGLP